MEDVDKTHNHPHKLFAGGLLWLWLRPRYLFRSIAEQEHAIWLLPMILLSLAVLFHTFAIGNIHHKEQGEIVYPNGFEYYTPEEQKNFTNAIEISRAPLFLYGFPGVAALGGVWIEWWLLSLLLRLCFGIAGSKSKHLTVRNMVAWTTAPIALQFFLKGLFIFISQKELVATSSFLDIYLLLQFCFLLLGSLYTSKLPFWKAWPLVFIALAITQTVSYFGQEINVAIGGLLS